MILRFLIPAVLMGVAVCPRAAEAQIYAWRDASGHLVLSDQPGDPSAQSFAVSPASTFRTTAPASPRAALYAELIEKHSRREGVNADLVRAVIQAESAFNPLAVSPKGARGLMQLMPATAAELGVRDVFDPDENIRGGVAYLKRLLVRYGENVELALAAYNAGPGAVARYGSVPPYRETRDYVEKIRAATGHKPANTTRIYRTVEIVDGREIVKYTNVRSEHAEVVQPRTGS